MKLFSTAFALSLLGVLMLAPSSTPACPFCSAPSLTLSEQASQSDVFLLAEWIKGQKDLKDDGDETASTTFKVKRILKGNFEVDQTIELAGYNPGEAGDLFLLSGLGADVAQWDVPTPISEKAFEYLAKAPAPQTADGEKVAFRDRLPYFVKHLEFPDETVANDAYAEFANAPYEEIVAVKETFPHEKIREWVLDPETPPARLGLYGLLLGLCGTPDDAEQMEKLIAKPTDEFRIGLDGVMSGYMLLKGEPALEVVRELKLENEFLVDGEGREITDDAGEKIPVPFSETYAAMQAVRFMWDYGAGRIDAEQLRAAMRTLLGRPELADLAIADLARWKDWSIMDRLAKLYEDEAYQVPGIKRSIIRYFDAATKDRPKDVEADETAKLPEHVKEAQEHYAAIKQKDPETVKSVEQFLILVQ